MSKNPAPKLDSKGIVMIIIAIGIIYILATNIITLVIAGLLFVVAILIALYFILPALGVSGIAGLLTIIGLGRKK